MDKKKINWWLSGGGFTVPGFSLQHMWHKFDIATTNADPVTVSTDSLTTTPYNLGNFNTAPARGVQNSKECIEFLGTGGLRTGATVGNALYRSSFSIFMQVKLDDGQPVGAEFLFKDQGAAGNRVSFVVGSTGVLQAIYQANSLVATATSGVIFADGPMSDFASICITCQSGGSLIIYVKLAGGSWSSVATASMAAVTMSAYDQGVGSLLRTYVGSTEVGANYLNGFMRNFIIQPGIYSASDMEALSNL